jgi:hypothetical protein
MPRWYVLLDGPSSDLVHVKRLFTTSNLSFDQIDGKDTLSAPSLDFHDSRDDALEAALELLNSINVALRLSVDHYNGFDVHGILEKRPDGTIHRLMLAQGGAYALSGAAAVGIAGFIGEPVRSREERLVSLIKKNATIADLAVQMTARPLTWGSMNTMYESAKGLMSPQGDRKDYHCLINLGWISKDDSGNFWKTAGYHRHGYPKEGTPTMEYSYAVKLIKGLFWRLVDALEPK